jgi:hypothetical protein
MDFSSYCKFGGYLVRELMAMLAMLAMCDGGCLIVDSNVELSGIAGQELISVNESHNNTT